MSFQTPIRIADAISRIRNRRLLLPAIQREFVWAPEKVEWLFDSLLQGYPIGSLLFWEIREEKPKADYQWYEFLQNYREVYKTYNQEFKAGAHGDFEAVLDGQQRLTAMYIGLTGTYAYKKPRVWWENTEWALPSRKLYLNIESEPKDDKDEETGRKYDFRLLTKAEYDDGPSKWFLVARILDLGDAFDLSKMMRDEGLHEREFASRALLKLHSVVHVHPTINYYLVRDADLEQALNVFVRVNTGGQHLSLSDVLMSTVIASWTQRDARKEVSSVVESVRSKGFFITKDFILKACVYLYSSDIRYRVSSFSKRHTVRFEADWDQIRSSITAVFDLVRMFGYTDITLTSKNALLPILYYVHHRALANTVISATKLDRDRVAIRQWLHLMLLKSVFSGSADTVLSAIRKAFTDDVDKYPIRTGLLEFPAKLIARILRDQGRDPEVTDEFIQTLLLTQYEDKQAFPVLALLSPNLDYKNGNFHKDHMHPASLFKTRNDVADLSLGEGDLAFYKDPRNWNSILNLQNLDANENMSKQDAPLCKWVQFESKRQNISDSIFCSNHNLPADTGLLDIRCFRDFIEERRRLLGNQLRQVLEIDHVAEMGPHST